MPNYERTDKVDLFVEGCLAQMEVGREWFETRVLPLSLDQLRWRSRVGAWSILECLSCLHHTFELYVPKIELAIREDPRLRGRSASNLPFAAAEEEFLKRFEPPIGTSLPPPRFDPVPATSPDRIVDQHLQLRGRYSAAVRTASALDLANILVEGSIHPLVRSLGGIVAFLAASDRLHIWRAERVRIASGFPDRDLQK
jgi:hypothetical protein